MLDAPKECHLVLDQEITRRKRWHYVCDPDGAVLYQSHRSGECWQWIQQEGFLMIHIHADKGIVTVEIDPLLQP